MTRLIDRPIFKSLTALATIIALTTSAAAQTAAEDRIARLESAVQDLQGVVYAVESTAGAPVYGAGSDAYGYGTGGDAADLTVRLSALEREIQSLTGRVEELAFRIDQNTSRIDTLTDIAAGTSTGRGYGTMTPQPDEQVGTTTPSSSGYPTGSTGGSAGPVDLVTGETNSGPVSEIAETAGYQGATDPDTSYDTAFNAVLVGDYDTAQAEFDWFVTTWPDDPRAPDAQFRLGEIYLATGDDQAAASAFLKHAHTWPDNARADEAYLKLGTSLSNLGKTTEACQVLGAMDDKFPQMTLNMRTRVGAERDRAGC